MDTRLTGTSQPEGASAGSGAERDDDRGGNIDKVRDILFGGQMREYDRRFTRLEERLVRETTELRDDIRSRLTALEQFVKQETAALSDRLTAEHDTRTSTEREIDRAQRELRQHLLEVQQRLSDDLRHKIDDVLARLGREAAELRADKTDRAALAGLLTEMAMRLTNDLSIPGIDNGKLE